MNRKLTRKELIKLTIHDAVRDLAVYDRRDDKELRVLVRKFTRERSSFGY